MTVLTVIGASGRNGRLAVEEALARGLQVRAGSRDTARLHMLLPEHPALSLIALDGTDEAAMTAALDGVHAAVLAHGDDSRPEAVNYRVVRCAIAAAQSLARPPRLVLMSGMSVTQQVAGYQDVEDWRRRGERLLRACGLPYCIVRPGWFDMHSPGDDAAVFEQGDRIPLGSMRGVSRRHIGQALVEGALCPGAVARTVELYSDPGAPVEDWNALFAAATPDPADALDGVDDLPGLPLDAEPQRVLDDLERYRPRPS